MRDVTLRYVSVAQLGQRPGESSTLEFGHPKGDKLREPRPKDATYYSVQYLGSAVFGMATFFVGLIPVLGILGTDTAAAEAALVGVWSIGAASGAHFVAKRFG